MIKTKKQKIIGTQNYINQDSGEIVECLVVEKNVENDFNFHKIWIEDLVSILEIVGSKKLKVVKWILNNFNDKDNTIFFTQQKLSKELNISYPILNETIKILMENNFMSRVQNGVYMLNPNIIVKGKSSKRSNLLVKYTNIKKD